MDYGRNIVHEITKNKTKEVAASELAKGIVRAKRLGVWMRTAKEMNAKAAIRAAEIKEKRQCRKQLPREQ